MKKLIWTIIATVSILLAGGYFNRINCLGDEGPKVAVQNYLAAMKDERFEDAYRFVTTSMTDGQSLTEWAGQQRRMFAMAKIVINKLDVREGHRELKNMFTCASTARVSNVLHASDVLNKQGSSEYEVYTLVRDDGAWKIDSQETFFDEVSIRQWFPQG